MGRVALACSKCYTQRDVSKHQNARAPIRVTLDLDAKDYASLEKLGREIRTMSKAETLRRLVRFAIMNPQIVNEKTI